MNTLDDLHASVTGEEAASPGLVMIFSQGRPTFVPVPLGEQAIVIGRAQDAMLQLDESRVSRRHAQVARSGRGVRVTDLGSRNGTFVGGIPVSDQSFSKLPCILRVGHTLFLITPAIRSFFGAGVECTEESVIGPTLRECLAKIRLAAAAGSTLLVTGPSGSGKELAARAFHAATGRQGPFIAVNCAAIPPALAERLLFGARRGAYSGAVSDAEGYALAANGGTLFLDEIAELDASVQAKLLRLLEQREVLELGASRPRKIDVCVCAATLKNLRAEVSAGRFREDLYYRIGRPEVRMPALVERLEDLPWLARMELARIHPELTAHALFLEACAVRSWPGNVRELLLELRHAAQQALAAGRTLLDTADLALMAGRTIDEQPRRPRTPAELSRPTVEAALQREKGNVTRAAQALGLHRNQLRRWLARHGINAADGAGSAAS